MSEKELIKACRKQNRNAQNQLYTLYKDRLFILCLKYCRTREEAEDILQESFVSIFTQIKKYKESGSFEGWMKRITINKAIDSFKKESGKFQVITDQTIKVDETVASEYLNIPLDELLSTIQELPDRYRLVFNLYELDDFSHKEISEMLNISVGTSKSNLSRAKQALKEKLLTKNQKYKTSKHGS
ncbi:MAG: RNA polymerase sigma factor [bacterium]